MLRKTDQGQQLPNLRAIVHSSLRQNCGDRLTAAPAGKRKLKLGNKAINAKRNVQNRIGRETLRREEQTS
ncbi:hypothetical protein GCG54_00014045 [Colletotrichum gloeosporioides]|uniref:Uncharacterized protein n=1 Tax=Colletotrichum gloeosporioides TaxID=474922 RepID=A0A8H4CU44_COLGL|nr:uncharacterized protein GCG54_00014045 [Colletotrichum gloeosporioides]KAF3809832.1 hypothetical protein GCG54_00014045 [Colletotrichum gloeosporioides]